MTQQTIDLSKPRIIVIKDRGHQYTLTVAPVTKKQWLKYFEGIVSLSETVAGKRIDSFDSKGARLALVNEVLADAHGYKTLNDVPITSLPDWRNKIPLGHRAALGEVLTAVERSQAVEEDAIMLGGESVSLDAVWSWNGTDSMVKVTGLKHIFGSPTVEQQRRYNRDMSRSQIIGGSRSGKTRWMGAQATLVELYDELITSVEDYDVDGVPVCDDREQIIAKMDTYHKVAAAETLFTPASAAISDGEDA
jgi:hypothetical protein